jgi:hypothetical protein
MIPNCGSEILKFSPGSCLQTSLPHIGNARPPINVEESLVSEEVQQALEPGGSFSRPRVLDRNVVRIDGNYICDFDGTGFAVSDAWGAVSGDLILSECSLSLFNFAFAETSAALGRAVPDDEDSASDDPSFLVMSGGFKPQPDSFASTRHSSLILSMQANVV